MTSCWIELISLFFSPSSAELLGLTLKSLIFLAFSGWIDAFYLALTPKISDFSRLHWPDTQHLGLVARNKRTSRSYSSHCLLISPLLAGLLPSSRPYHPGYEDLNQLNQVSTSKRDLNNRLNILFSIFKNLVFIDGCINVFFLALSDLLIPSFALYRDFIIRMTL